MAKIKFYLKKLEKALVFQILEMDEKFRAQTEEDRVEFKYRQFSICSKANPSISDNESILYVRGYNRKEDFKITTLTFKSNNERDEHFKRILTTLTQWAKKWPGWEQPDKIDIDDSEAIII